MGLGKMLNWSQTSRDGTPRSTLAKIIDPVGVCIEPAALDPFVGPDAPLTSESDDVDAPAADAPVARRMDYTSDPTL